MKKLAATFAILFILLGVWWLFLRNKSHGDAPKLQPLKVSVHSKDFNASVAAAVNGYLKLKDAFVEGDTASVKSNEKKFVILIDSIKIIEMKKDTTGIYESVESQMSDIKSNANAILKENDITEMRQDFRMISENLFPFLKTIKYEGQKLYWQNCPMAFGEGKDGNWISNTEEIINPYLGKKNPEFKATMVHCGEIKDTIQ